jgi:hypothetical protein
MPAQAGTAPRIGDRGSTGELRAGVSSLVDAMLRQWQFANGARRIEARGGFMALEANQAELVKVFDTEQESEAMVVQGLLESAGIESLISSLDAPQEILPGVGGVIVQVRPDQADEARKMIEDYRTNPASDAEVTEEPTA